MLCEEMFMKKTHTHTVGESLKTRPCVNVVHIFNVLFTLY